MAKKEKSGSAAVQSSAEKVKAQEPVVEPVAKQPSAEAPASEVPAAAPGGHGCGCARSRERMLFELYCARLSAYDTVSTQHKRETLFKWALDDAYLCLGFFEAFVAKNKM